MQNGRIKQLDGWRGLAILFVLCFHFFDFGFLKNVFYFGWSGVDLFFTLSGFLITGILLDTKNNSRYYQSFIIRRILRIFPLYYAVLLVFLFISRESNATNWFPQYQVYFWTYTSNYLFMEKGFFQPLGHFWSLAIEEQFYLIWPLVVLITTRRQLILISLFLIILGIIIRATSNSALVTFGNPLAHLDGLLFGATAAVLVRENKELVFKNIRRVVFIATIFFSIYLITYLFTNGIQAESEFYKLPLTFTFVSVIFSSMLVLSLKNAFLKTLLSNKILLFFGKYSYGMYVFNSIIFHYLNWLGVDRFIDNVKLIFYLFGLLLTVLISYISFNFYEVHFLKLKEKFAPT